MTYRRRIRRREYTMGGRSMIRSRMRRYKPNEPANDLWF